MHRSLTTGVALFGTMLCCLGVMGEEPKKTNSYKDDQKAATVAATINFQTELGLEFESLKSLGLRIDQAQTTPDPVSLALAAQELAVAEKVSGKQASVKAADLMKAAVEAAQCRGSVKELKALEMLVTDEATKKTLQGNITQVEKLLAEYDARIKSGESPRGVSGNLTVNNNTSTSTGIYINDRYVGFVAARSSKVFTVGDTASYECAVFIPQTKLFARGAGTKTWGPRVISEDKQNMTWNLFGQ